MTNRELASRVGLSPSACPSWPSISIASRTMSKHTSWFAWTTSGPRRVRKS
ncbi:AsnC family protein [Sinorhizobium fredii]|uniref:AsnC family protein n=1 Tax=Rhizobium fredii TaxID=380 RepID=UPI001376D705